MRAMQEIEWIGESGGIAALRDDMVLCSSTDAKVLITAASGVDRALIARTIHNRSARASRRFTRVNCGDAAEAVVEARLFGQHAGRHSGERRARAGAIELADGGTVFLNEVGNLSPRLQALLLRYLATGEVRRVDSVQGRAVNARIIAATSRTLSDRIRSGWFREDLFYRLNVIHIVVPPLAERREDVPLIVEYLLDRLPATMTGRRPAISPRAMAMLLGYPWPGNVRELRLVLEKLATSAEGDVAEVHDLPARIRLWQPNHTCPPGRSLRSRERRLAPLAGEAASLTLGGSGRASRGRQCSKLEQ